MKYYVIISTGAYSDYSPTYFAGDVPITQEEFTQKAEEIGDQVYEEFLALPEREHVHKPLFSSGDRTCGTASYMDCPVMEKYDPLTDKRVRNPDSGEWRRRLKAWVVEKGYEEVPEDLPEINTYYDIPLSKKYRKDTNE